jgi:hypothetical protein
MEKRHGARTSSLRGAVWWLMLNRQNLKEVEKGCEDCCKAYPGTQFEFAFNLYVSCLKHPPKK